MRTVGSDVMVTDPEVRRIIAGYVAEFFIM